MAGNRDIAIRCRGISKTYGPIQALYPTDLSIRQGTIHALVGQNGAGKSTFLGVLAGRIVPSSGSIEIFDEHPDLSDPRRARTAGIVGIYQELATVAAMTAAENVYLGQMPSRNGFVSRTAMRNGFIELCAKLGVNIDPTAMCRSLSVADQQIIEIMRALNLNARIILFDEPTASLGQLERRALFRVMSDLRAAGHTMLFVSHNLDEVLDIADEISVFRNGRLVETKSISQWNKKSIASAMLGADMADIYRRRAGEPLIENEVLLRAADISVRGALAGISFELRRGEVLGIGGLVGSGRTTLLRALGGLERDASGSLWVNGLGGDLPRSPRQARRMGIALMPEDRKAQGLIPAMSAMENMAIVDLPRCARAGMLVSARLKDVTGSIARRFLFDLSRLRDQVANLSGGNQQKILLARSWYSRPLVLLVDEPTRGIDIGAKSEILNALREFADQDVGVIMVSSEWEELSSLADRVIVLSEGRFVGELDAKVAPITIASILGAAFKVEQHPNG